MSLDERSLNYSQDLPSAPAPVPPLSSIKGSHHMSFTKKIVLAALAATMLLALTAGTAAALRSLSLSSRTIATLSAALTLSGGISDVCAVGITLTLTNNPIAKTARANIGTAAVRILNPERCSITTSVLAGPYNVNYLGFTGTLPNITGIILQLLGVEFLIRTLGQGCNIRANALGTNAISAGAVGTLSGRPFGLEGVRVTTLEGFACPEAGEVRLLGTFTPVGSIRLTLI
jgi:hypothetical protein